MLRSVDSVTVHGACYRNYGNDRLASFASRRSGESAPSELEEPGELREPEEEPQLEPIFDYKNKCLFCGDVIKDQRKLSTDRRRKIHSVIDSSMTENIEQYLAGRDDDFSVLIRKRIQDVPDLVAAGARYHRECMSLVYHPLPVKGTKKGRPAGDNVDAAMEDIYSFLMENSDECQFSMEELMAQIKGDFVPHVKTVKRHLQIKYGQDILINEKQGRDCVVCFRNTGLKILSDQWKCKEKCGTACGC